MTSLQQFSADVQKGLSSKPKYLSSRYFYDAKGDKIFIEIMNMPEYYLTRSEYEILQDQTESIVRSLNLKSGKHMELIELGAGDGLKTIILLKYLVRKGYSFDYIPIDISVSSLDHLTRKIDNQVPEVEVKPMQGDYFRILQNIQNSGHQKTILFLGSNLGNMNDIQAQHFLSSLADKLQTGDHLLLGLDLIKSKHIVLPAYNDASGITAKFNLNLLERINRELGGNFDLRNFEHIASFSEEEGVAKSYLKSKVTQIVRIQHCRKYFNFEEGELIHTEISRKYNDEILENILTGSNLTIKARFRDQKEYFADYILEKAG